MPDTELELIEATWSALARRRRQWSIESMESVTDTSTDIEAVLLLAWEARMLVGEGGFMMFLQFNLPLEETANAFAIVGLDQVTSIFRRVQDLFPDRRVPQNYEQRMAMVDHLYDVRRELMGELEMEFLGQDALIQKQLAAWIRIHKLNV